MDSKWDSLLEEIRKIKNQQDFDVIQSEYPDNLLTNTESVVEEVEKKAEDDLQQKWYQFGDWFTNQDELLRAILAQLQAMATVEPQQPTEPTPIIPPGMLPKLDTIASAQIRTKELLEGFSFLHGQSTIQTTNTSVEVVSTIKTYLIAIRAAITNTGTVYIGGRGVSNTNGYAIDPGEAVVMQINNIKKQVWMTGTAGDSVSWIALVD